MKAWTRSPEDVPETVRRYLQERAVITASLIARAQTEVYLRNHRLPAGPHVITRQIQNTRLRELGLWEKLEPAESAAAIAADGWWMEAQCVEVFPWSEQLRLLRWTLGVDDELSSLARSPRVDYASAHDLLERGLDCFSGRTLRTSWDVSTERKMALAYFAYIVAELRSRSLIDRPAPADAVDDPRRESPGDYTDILAGSETIDELEDESLKALGLVAHARQHYGAWLVEILRGTTAKPYSEWAASGRIRLPE